MSLNRNGFQTFVNRHLAPGVVGAFASMNPRATVLAGPGALKADEADPVVVGYFAWAVPATGLAHGAEQANSFLGFVSNEGQTVITEFLGQDRLVVQAGFPVTLYSHGDFWTRVAGGAVTVGATIYAVAATGQPTIDAAAGANPDTGFVAATAAPADVTSTASSLSTAGVLTVGGTIAGTIDIGDGNSVVVNGVGVPDNTFIQSQLTGTPGGAGTYQTTARLTTAIGPIAMTFSTGSLVKITRTF